jgi:hypothetical protein
MPASLVRKNPELSLVVVQLHEGLHAEVLAAKPCGSGGDESQS